MMINTMYCDASSGAPADTRKWSEFTLGNQIENFVALLSVMPQIADAKTPVENVRYGRQAAEGRESAFAAVRIGLWPRDRHVAYALTPY